MSNENFIDYVKILFRSGKGGSGSAHLARTAQTPKGGPDGGDGGRGGHIILRGNAQLWTLLHLKYTKHVFAENGESGSKNQCFGKKGKDSIIEVPLGTIVKNAETMAVEAEILEDGQELILMKGGRGGLGNVHFKSATFQTPRFAQPGEEGIESWKILELKVLADVGLIGFPNVGKSTFISVISNAKPKIANYPFTTLKPNLGMVKYRDNYSFVVADIPGIIEGAAEGKGLGLRFLRHIERNSVLLFLVPVDSENIKKEYKILLNELKKYNPELLDKKRMLAISKCDIVPYDNLEKIKNKLPNDLPVVFLSSQIHMGVDEIKDTLWNLLNTNN
ncbi:MAG TPA: GTPase ObgE [Bacteroidales bacterium]|nr:GTPase ObgE [Bacteroidales bacterium]HQB20623.1 GTPase ObgE [Bacteroidales bacterium]